MIKVLKKLMHRKVVSACRVMGCSVISSMVFKLDNLLWVCSVLSEAVHDWALALKHRKSVHSIDLATAFDSEPNY